MRLRVKLDKGVERLYIERSVRVDGKKIVTQNVEKLGRVDTLMAEKDMTREEVIAWAENRARELTEESASITVKLSQTRQIGKDVDRTFFGGYLFLQKLYYAGKMKNITRSIRERHRFQYDLDAILADLIFARVLEPCSKRSTYETVRKFLEPPKYEQHDIYRALSVLAEESDFIQSETYKNSAFLIKRNNRVLYYDCTNYTFEIEESDGYREYGKAKRHEPLPIVNMGLFMDGDGIPLAFDTFKGSQNEQLSLKPLEQKILKEYGMEKVVICTDAGLASEANRKFNHTPNRAFIVTQSLKKLKNEYREQALDDSGWRELPSGKPVASLKEIRESEKTDGLYYKEVPYETAKVPEQLMIVTYSSKYASYQKQIRAGQIKRAEAMLENGKLRKERRNPNDPARFVRRVSVTADGEVAERNIYSLNDERIRDEEMYDGYYAVCTDLLDDPVQDILKVSEGRWEIEESFRIMKTELKANPVYLSRKDRIHAHFLICFLALYFYRILEKKLSEKGSYTCEQIIQTLRDYKLLKVDGAGYLPEYTRTDLTDHLHELFDFRTDVEVVTTRSMRKIIAGTKK